MRDRIIPIWRGTLRRIPLVLVAFLALAALVNLAGYDFWPVARLVHFPLYGALIGLALALGYAMRRYWWLAAIASALALGFGAQVGRLWLKPASETNAPAAATATSPVTVMTFNVYASNREHAKVLTALKAASPEVLYLTEMTPAWHQALSSLAQSYPHRLGQKKNLLLSRFPLEDARSVPVTFDAAQTAIQAAGGSMSPLDESLRRKWLNTEILTATVIAGGKRMRLAVIHPPTPGPTITVLNQRVVALICRQELQSDPRADARVMMGDFNTTPFSPTFRFIVKQTGLRDSAQGYGYVPTWGPRLPREPWLPWLGIPIDHVLVSSNVDVLAREVGPALGSDHRWVMARIGVR